MSGDSETNEYLWDPTAPPAPDVVALERILSHLDGDGDVEEPEPRAPPRQRPRPASSGRRISVAVPLVALLVAALAVLWLARGVHTGEGPALEPRSPRLPSVTAPHPGEATRDNEAAESGGQRSLPSVTERPSDAADVVEPFSDRAPAGRIKDPFAGRPRPAPRPGKESRELKNPFAGEPPPAPEPGEVKNPFAGKPAPAPAPDAGKIKDPFR